MAEVGGPLGVTIGVISLFVLFASTGVAGLATTIGHRLPSPADADRPWKATIRGGIVLELAYLVPFLGWFVLLPGSLILGAGCAVRALIGNCRKNKAQGKPEEKQPEIATMDGAIGAPS